MSSDPLLQPYQLKHLTLKNRIMTTSHEPAYPEDGMPKDRYRAEVGRLYKVLDTRLAENEYVAGDFYSIADMAIWPWVHIWKRQEQSIEDKPHFARWVEKVGARPAVRKGRALHEELRSGQPHSKEAQSILFRR